MEQICFKKTDPNLKRKASLEQGEPFLLYLSLNSTVIKLRTMNMKISVLCTTFCVVVFLTQEGWANNLPCLRLIRYGYNNSRDFSQEMKSKTTASRTTTTSTTTMSPIPTTATTTTVILTGITGELRKYTLGDRAGTEEFNDDRIASECSYRRGFI